MDIPKPAYIAFQGGGALGMAHLGAWQILARRFHIIGVSGTSAGSIVAAFCAAGYDPMHVIEVFSNLQWPEFTKPQPMLDLLRKRNGWSDGERFYQWIKTRLLATLQDQSQLATFASLYQKTGIYLAIVASDLNDSMARPVIFDKIKEPETVVAFAVRASMSIPGIFVPVSRRDRGQLLVDGGLLLNLPVELLQPSAQKERCPLIGVRFKKPTEYLDSPNVKEILSHSFGLTTISGNSPPLEIKQDMNYIDVEIDVEGFGVLDFKLNDHGKRDLVKRGAKAAEDALLKYDLCLEQLSTKPVLINSNVNNRHLDVYLSRGWHQGEDLLANHVCRSLDKAGFRIIGDAQDHPSVSTDEGIDRIKSIMSNCGGLVAVAPDRGQGKTSKYILREIEIARTLGLPCLIVAEPTVASIKDLSPYVVYIPIDNLENNLGDVDLRKQVELFKDDWKRPVRRDYIFVATSLKAIEKNNVIRQVIEQVTALPCVMGDEIREKSMQGSIAEKISHALIVIADISGVDDESWNINTSIEAGIAQGAEREFYLLCRKPRRSPIFMFRDIQVEYYGNYEELSGIVHELVFSQRRLILNPIDKV